MGEVSQYDLIKQKVLLQATRVLGKLKGKESKGSSKELTNQDIALALCQYALKPSSISEDKRELLDDRMSRLSRKQMKAVKLFIFEGKTQEEVGNIMGKSRQWVGATLKESYRVMR